MIIKNQVLDLGEEVKDRILRAEFARAPGKRIVL